MTTIEPERTTEEKLQQIADYILRDYDARLTQSMFKLIEELKQEQNARTS